MSAGNLRSVPIPDGTIACREMGGGDPLVLLHGGALDHRMWDPQLPALADAFRVLAPDFRGHGRSSTPRTPFRHCDDIAALLRELGAGPAVLVGVSMGGGAAVDLALEQPKLVRALVVCGTGTSELEFTDPWVLSVLAARDRAAAEQDVEGWLDASMQFVNGPHRELTDVSPELVARVRQMAADTVAHHVPPEGPVLPEPVRNTWTRAGAITVPVLTISGSLDSTDHINAARRFAETVANGRAITIDGAAHYPNLEKPDEFTRQLRAFTARECR